MSSALPPRTDIAAPSGSLLTRMYSDFEAAAFVATVALMVALT
jgi:hypothetical protein